MTMRWWQQQCVALGAELAQTQLTLTHTQRQLHDALAELARERNAPCSPALKITPASSPTPSTSPSSSDDSGSSVRSFKLECKGCGSVQRFKAHLPSHTSDEISETSCAKCHSTLRFPTARLIELARDAPVEDKPSLVETIALPEPMLQSAPTTTRPAALDPQADWLERELARSVSLAELAAAAKGAAAALARRTLSTTSEATSAQAPAASDPTDANTGAATTLQPPVQPPISSQAAPHAGGDKPIEPPPTAPSSEDDESEILDVEVTEAEPEPDTLTKDARKVVREMIRSIDKSSRSATRFTPAPPLSPSPTSPSPRMMVPRPPASPRSVAPRPPPIAPRTPPPVIALTRSPSQTSPTADEDRDVCARAARLEVVATGDPAESAPTTSDGRDASPTLTSLRGGGKARNPRMRPNMAPAALRTKWRDVGSEASGFKYNLQGNTHTVNFSYVAPQDNQLSFPCASCGHCNVASKPKDAANVTVGATISCKAHCVKCGVINTVKLRKGGPGASPAADRELSI